MKKLHLNRKLFAIHSWLGLFLGIIYILISVGGASIVFMKEINQFLYGDKIRIEQSSSPKLSFDSLYIIAKKEYPNATMLTMGHDLDHPENAYTIGGLQTGKNSWIKWGDKFHSDYVNPYNGKIIFRTDNTGTGNVLAWLDTLHSSLRLGAAGSITVAFMSVTVLLSLITGLIFYRKSIIKVLLFKIKIKFKNWRTASSDLHRVIGTWALIFNLLIFGSGLYMFYTLLLPSGWNDMSKYVHEKPANAIVPKKITSLDSLVLKASEAIPQMNINQLMVMHDTSQAITVSGTTKEKLFLDADNYAYITFDYSGKVKEKHYKVWDELTFKEKYENVNWNIFHTGWAFGIAGKIIWTIMGFMPAFLSITGFLLWWRSKKKTFEASKLPLKQ